LKNVLFPFEKQIVRLGVLNNCLLKGLREPLQNVFFQEEVVIWHLTIWF